MILTQAGRSRNLASAGYVLRSPAYYISPTGSNSNAGTYTSPWQTFAYAQTQMQNTSTKITYVLAGTYSNFASISLNNADAGTTYSNYPNAVVILDGGNSTSEAFFGSASNSCSNIWINGFTIQNFVNNGVHWKVATNCVVTNCTFNNIATSGNTSQQAAIYSDYGNSNLAFQNNLFNNCGCPGTSCYDNCINHLIDANVYSACGHAFSDIGSIYAYSPAQAMGPSYLVTNNVVKNYGTNITNNQHAIYMDDLVNNTVAFGNVIYGVGQTAFELHGGIYNVLSNNVWDLTQAATWVIISILRMVT